MGILSAEQINAAPDRAETKTVTVPEWGGDVLVGIMSAADRDTWELENSKARREDTSNPFFRAGLVARCLVNAEGKRLFKDKDAAKLATKSGHVVDRLFDVAFAMNHLGDEGVQAAKKNSEAVPADGSSSSSPASTGSSPDGSSGS